MRIIIAIITTFLLLGWTHSFAEGDPVGCKWTVTEETDEYIMESCGSNNARIRQKSSIETIYVPQKEKLANPIDEYKKIVITSEGVETKNKIEKVEKDVENTAKKVEKIIEEKTDKEIAEEEEWNQIDEEPKTWLRLYQLLPKLIVENEKVKAAELDYEAAVEVLKKAHSAYYPQITVTYGSNWEDDRTPSKSSTVGDDSIKNDSKHGRQSSITITQMIWDFGRTSSLIDMERSKAQQTYYHLELAKEDLVIEAINAWLNLMKTYNVHEANKKIEANALKTLTMTIKKVKKERHLN